MKWSLCGEIIAWSVVRAGLQTQLTGSCRQCRLVVPVVELLWVEEGQCGTCHDGCWSNETMKVRTASPDISTAFEFQGGRFQGQGRKTKLQEGRTQSSYRSVSGLLTAPW